MQLTASLVLYKNDPEIVIQAIKSLFGTSMEINLSVVDNSPTDELKKIFDNFQEYDIDSVSYTHLTLPTNREV